MECERLDARVAELDRLLETADQPQDDLPAGTAGLGRLVELRFPGDSTTERFLLGTIEKREAGVEVVTADRPLGRALLGQLAGTSVTYIPRSSSPALSVELVVVVSAEIAVWSPHKWPARPRSSSSPERPGRDQHDENRH